MAIYSKRVWFNNVPAPGLAAGVELYFVVDLQNCTITYQGYAERGALSIGSLGITSSVEYTVVADIPYEIDCDCKGTAGKQGCLKILVMAFLVTEAAAEMGLPLAEYRRKELAQYEWVTACTPCCCKGAEVPPFEPPRGPSNQDVINAFASAALSVGKRTAKERWGLMEKKGIVLDELVEQRDSSFPCDKLRKLIQDVEEEVRDKSINQDERAVLERRLKDLYGYHCS